MNNTFDLKKGKLIFEDEKVVITDNAKYERRYRLFSTTILLLLGLSFSIQYLKTNEMSTLRLGLIFVAFALIHFVYEFFKSTQSEILLKDVKSFSLNRFLFRDILYIKLNNHKTRMVYGIFNTERVEEYLESIHFNSKIK